MVLAWSSASSPAHNGEIAVESAEGQGTTMMVRLPVADAAPSEAVLLPTHALTLLVIDDEPLLAETLRDVLRILGHEAVIATSGVEGLHRLATEHFDLVMTDLGMPEMSGWEVAMAIKVSACPLPVILVTGWGDSLESDRIERTGIAAVLAKPYTTSQLRNVLSAAHYAHPAGCGERPRGRGQVYYCLDR